MKTILSMLTACAVAVSLCAEPTNSIPSLPRVPAVAPADAAKTFHLLDGFRMELLAAEPLVTDPVAVAYDEDGRAYVCEMNDYPYTDKARHKPNQENPTDEPLGKVRLLVDADGDGKFDKSTIFADHLSWPTGIVCWKGGVFVAATPDVWYFKDTNGDGVADVRKKVFTGFRKLNVQAVFNNLQWGLDNWIYGAGSSNGGEIRHADQPGASPMRLSHHDVRFDPVTEAFELLSGGARFGLGLDDWGNRFLCSIRQPAIHVVLPARYLARNTYAPVRSPLSDAAEAGEQLPVHPTAKPEKWREIRALRWAAAGEPVPRSETRAGGVVTSASGIIVYRGAAYPEKYRGNLFVGEPAQNLFYRLDPKPDGVTFNAIHADKDVDFFTSDDNWCRPVNFANAPDGTLHMLDMYRECIEHPWSIPDDLHAALDLRSGSDRGRIWRMEPPGFKTPKPPRLGSASIATLVATLENPNGWWRDTAQRLLFERQDQAAIVPLRDLLHKSQSPLARLHALYTLQGLGALADADILLELHDESAGVRKHAVELAESRLKQSPLLLEKILDLANDKDVRVRFQVAFTLGKTKHPRTSAALAAIAKRDAADPWVRAAVLSSVAETCGELLADLLMDAKFSANDSALDFIRELAVVVGARNRPAEVSGVLGAAAQPNQWRPVQRAVLLGLGDGLKRSGRSLSKAADPASPSGKLVVELLDDAQQSARAEKLPVVQRQQAIQLLGYDSFERVQATFKELLGPQQPVEVQMAAVQTLGKFSSDQIARMLLEPWRSLTPAVRNEVVQALLARKERLTPLLDAVEDGRILPLQIPPTRKGALLRNTDATIRERAAQLLGKATASRQEIVEKFRAALSMKGDPRRGQKVYETNCMLCHHFGNQGKEVGPNLESVAHRTPEEILTNILDPNREVSPNFMQYELELQNGDTVSGIITDETPTSITLKRAEGIQDTILRRNITRMIGSGMSLMPEGLEAKILPPDMADLLAFVLGGKR